ncbi:MAG: hypothetical protein EOP51_21970 [Sphingobacteriales bacterium]|nr:MAG: hypothetical protein EOP51_21970 [Sphingobacteriales bacterium]
MKTKMPFPLQGLLLLLPLLFFACKKDNDNEPGLPPATQEGRNTFGCKVNGQVWVNGGDDWKANYKWADYIDSSGVFYLGGSSSKNNQHSEVGLVIKHLPFSGIINSQHQCNGWYRRAIYQNNVSNIQKYVTDSLFPGTVTITKFDTINLIVSGTFQFKAKLEDGTETVDITDGRFDLRFNKF